MVMGGDTIQEVVGSNFSTEYWMDIFHIFCCKNCNGHLKKQVKFYALLNSFLVKLFQCFYHS